MLWTVLTVLEASELVPARIVNGYRVDKGGKTPIYERGLEIKDPTIAEKLLPTAEGFFFGSTDYNQYYIDDLKLTKEIILEALKQEGGEYEYHSSW